MDLFANQNKVAGKIFITWQRNHADKRWLMAESPRKDLYYWVHGRISTGDEFKGWEKNSGRLGTIDVGENKKALEMSSPDHH